MTRTDLREEIREDLGEPDAEKTWSNSQLNRHINAVLRDLSCCGAFYGSATGTGDGSAVYDLPKEIVSLTMARIGETEYWPITPGYARYLDEVGYWVQLDPDPESESGWTCTFPDDVATGTTITFIGRLWHEMLDPTDENEDDTVLSCDDRFRNAIVYFVCARALRATEDEYKRYWELYQEELNRFGFRTKLSRTAQFHQPEKKEHNRCRW
jgi:hypothetical protein